MYYDGYLISEEYDYLDSYQISILNACCWMVDNKATIRKTAENWGFSSTTLWRRIHYECSKISPELYGMVKIQIKINLERVGR